MNTNKKALLAVAMVALMLAVPFTVIGGQDESDAAETNWPAMSDYSYKVTFGTESPDLTVADHLNEDADVTSWTWNANGVGPFNMFYAAISTGATDANALSNTPGHIAYILNPDNLEQAVKYNGSESAFDISGVIANYNIMLVIPTVYWGVSDSAYYLTNVPSNTKNNGISFAPYAHMVDGKDVYPYLAIGVYEAKVVGGKGLMSQSGGTPTVNKSTDEFRAHVYEANSLITDGVGTYQIWNFYEWTLYKLLAQTYIKSFDSSAVAGGRINKSAIGSNGLGDSVGPVSPAGASEYGKILVENAWGNVWDLLDNTYVELGTLKAGSAIGCTLSPSDIRVDGKDYTGGSLAIASENSGKSIATFSQNAATFGVPLTAGGDDAGKVIPDTIAFNLSRYSALDVGGTWNSKSDAGLSAWNSYTMVGLKNTNVGTRLAYLMSADAADAEPTCTITYRAMDGSAIAGINPTTAREGVAHTLPAAPAAPTGYSNFLGWYTAPAYGAKIGVAGASYTPASNMDLYAVFTPYSAYTQTIVYNEWNGSAYAATQTGVVSGGSYLAMPAPFSTVKTVGNVDYKFMGWAAKDAAPTEISTDAAQQKVGTLYTYTPAANAELSITSQFYAVYQATYTVTFTNGTDSITVSGIAGERVQAPNMFSSETGKLLQGYYTDSTSQAIVATYGTWIEIPANDTTYTAVFMDVGSGGSSDITMYDVATDIIWVDDQGETIATAPFDVTFSKKIASGSYGLVSVKKNADYAAGQSVVLTLLKNDDSGDAANANITQIDGSFWMISSVLENVKIKATVSTSTETGMSAFYVSGTADKNNQVRVVLESESDAGLAQGSVTLGGTYKTVNGQGQSKYGAITEALIDTVDGQTGQAKEVAGGESKISSVFGLKDSKQAYYVYATYTVEGSAVCSMAVLTPALYEDDN